LRRNNKPPMKPIDSHANSVKPASINGVVPAVVEIGGGSPAVHQTGWTVVEVNEQPGEPTMKQYWKKREQANKRSEKRITLALEAQLPMEELIAGVRHDIESFAAELGLSIMQRVMEAEIEQKAGQWGQQAVFRYGQQPGYVIFGGRK